MKRNGLRKMTALLAGVLCACLIAGCSETDAGGTANSKEAAAVEAVPEGETQEPAARITEAVKETETAEKPEVTGRPEADEAADGIGETDDGTESDPPAELQPEQPSVEGGEQQDAAGPGQADASSEEGTASEDEALEGTPAEETPAEEMPAEGTSSGDTGTEETSEEAIGLDPGWEFAGYSVISSGTATLFRASGERKGIVVGVNAGHGTSGGGSVYTQCHPDGTPKVTGGTNAEGSVEAMAVSSGMTFYDGTPERDANLQVAQLLKDMLLAEGYDVLMIRNGEDVQLDNIARTVICNNCADCHIAIHFDGDGLDYDKGCFYMAVPDGIKGMYPVSEIWTEDDRLGESLIAGLASAGCLIMPGGSIQQDLTQTSYSKVPSVDVELGNAASDHSEEAQIQRAAGLLAGINVFFGY